MRLHLGRSATSGAVTVFPVWHDRPVAADRGYTTRTAHLDVGEADGGPDVGRLVAANSGAEPVLILEGQLFEGGWQHRMALSSTLVPAGARAAIDVACVEEGRWHGATAQRTRGRRATTLVRSGYDAGGQGRSGSVSGATARPRPAPSPSDSTGRISTARSTAWFAAHRFCRASVVSSSVWGVSRWHSRSSTTRGPWGSSTVRFSGPRCSTVSMCRRRPRRDAALVGSSPGPNGCCASRRRPPVGRTGSRGVSGSPTRSSTRGSWSVPPPPSTCAAPTCVTHCSSQPDRPPDRPSRKET